MDKVKQQQMMELSDDYAEMEPELICTQEIEQEITWDATKVITVPGQPHQVVLPHTPVKIRKVERINWTDEMKLQLLRLFIQFAKDVYARDKGGMTARRVMRAQLKPIWEKLSILVDDKEIRLDQFNLDNMAKIMVCNGLSGQTGGQGLVHLIDAWVEDKGDNVVDIRDMVEDIMEFARSKCN